MKARCHNPKNKRWDRYGGRGIMVCSEWLVFSGFLKDMGERPEGTTLDRIEGNYEPGNCRWATDAEQIKMLNLPVIAGKRLPVSPISCYYDCMKEMKSVYLVGGGVVTDEMGAKASRMLDHPFPCEVCHQSLADQLCTRCEGAMCGGCVRQHKNCSDE